MNPPHPVTSDGFVWQDPAAAEAKLNHYRQGGKQLLHVVWDWDGTVVPEPGSSWYTLRDALPPDKQQAHRALYAHYRPLEVSGKLTSALEREWSSKALSLQIENRTLLADIERSAEELTVRQGAEAAFAVCEQAGVPMVILSAGIKNIILHIAQKHGMHPTSILATELLFADGRVVDWDKDSMIISQAKHEHGHPELSALRKQHPHALLFGNAPHDATMFEGDGLRIRVDGHSAVGTKDWAAYLQESWQAGYDGVTIRDNLLAVAELTKWLLTPDK